jgi:glycosyltransferase involved in cell wall biosynthesis
MRILLGCINVNGLGGSEMYHYELAKELHLANHDVTLFTLRNINYLDPLRQKLSKLGVKQIDLNSFTPNNYDIIIASQPETNKFLINNTPSEIPIVSIIHSEIRSEDPVIHPRIKHYICIRQSISDLLVSYYGMSREKISLIYNPIDKERFSPNNSIKVEKTTGIFIGGAQDNIRVKALMHMASQCIENDWDLWIMSNERLNYEHPNIKYLEPRWDTEIFVKQVHFTAGILMGRTTLEGWCCGIPGYMYLIDIYGDIINIETEGPDNIIELCDGKYVAKQHLNLYNQIINNENFI